MEGKWLTENMFEYKKMKQRKIQNENCILNKNMMINFLGYDKSQSDWHLKSWLYWIESKWLFWNEPHALNFQSNV